MTEVLGPNTRGVIHLISHLDHLGASEIDAVAAEWKRRPRQDRAAARAAVAAVTTRAGRQAILDAADLARREAMTVARRHHRADWTFWAAVWDAALGVAACDRVDRRHHQTLVAPLAQVLPWLRRCRPDRVGVSGLQALISQVGAPDE